MAIDLSMVRGDTAKFRLTVTRSGSLIDVSGATFVFSARRWKSDVTTVIQKDNNAFEDVSLGIVICTLDPEDTIELTDDTILNYDFEMTEMDGRVTTVAYGQLEVIYDITR